MYDYSQEVEFQREVARGNRAKAEELRRMANQQAAFLEDLAKRAETLADHIQLICTKK